MQTALFLLAAFFALLLLTGLKTRFATIASWVMLMSLQARNPMILQAGDSFLRMLLFFGMFLPLGAKFSLDALFQNKFVGLSNEKYFSNHYFSVATMGLLLQVAFVYWFTAAIKLLPKSFSIWWGEGSAIYYALSLDYFTRPFGYFILSLPEHVLSLMTRSVILFEMIGPFFLFMPFFTSTARVFGVLGFVGLHAGFGLCMNLGPFPLVSITAVLPFIPAGVWDVFLPKHKDVKELGCVGLKWPINLALVFCIIYIFIWNLGTVYPKIKIKNPVRKIGVWLGFEQSWNMFAPPARNDGWYVVSGKLKNGREVDLFKNGQPINWEKPKSVSSVYKSERDRKYMMNLALPKNRKHLLYYGKYVCRDWNSRYQDEEQLQSFEVIFNEEKTLPPRQTPQIRKKVLWRHWCFKA